MIFRVQDYTKLVTKTSYILKEIYNMKNKRILSLIAIIAVITLFSVTAFATAPQYEGYEALKTILKSNHSLETVKNGTFSGSFSATDNGSTLFAMEGTGKFDETAKSASGHVNFSIDAIQREASFFGGNDTAYFVDETHQLNYQLINMDNMDCDDQSYQRDGHFNSDHEMTAMEESIFDNLMGDLKNQITVEYRVDGSKNVTLDLTKNEIPAPIGLLINIAAASDATFEHNNHQSDLDSKELELLKSMPFFEGLCDEEALESKMPELKKDIVIEGVMVSLEVDSNNQIQSFNSAFSISGLDDKGNAHFLSFVGEGSISDINATIVDSFQSLDQPIETIDVSQFECKDMEN